MRRLKAMNLFFAAIWLPFGIWQMIERGNVMASYLPPGSDLAAYGVHSWAANVEFGAGALYMLQLGVVCIAVVAWGDLKANRLILWAGCVQCVMGAALNVHNFATDPVFESMSKAQLLAPWLVPLALALAVLRTTATADQPAAATSSA